MPALRCRQPASDAAAFDQLAGELGSSYRDLERRLDALQQELSSQRPLATLGEMSAGLAHQVRTPLAAALVYACHLRDATLDAADRARFAERLIERLRRLERLVDDMLAYAHGADAGAQRFSLADLMQALAATVQPQCPAGVRLTLPRPDAQLHLKGSLENLAGALANLCLNAFEAGAGTVTLERLPTVVGQLRLAVSDDGPGLAPAVRGRLFEPFVSGRPGGTGLGLAVARGVIERHHGTLRLADATADSTADSASGCRFEITLPCALGRRPVARELLEA